NVSGVEVPQNSDGDGEVSERDARVIAQRPAVASHRTVATYRGLVRSLADGRGETGVRCRAERCAGETGHGAKDKSARELGKKFQTSSSKLQRSSKHQTSRALLGAWCLEFLWSLELGVWSFASQLAVPSRECTMFPV